MLFSGIHPPNYFFMNQRIALAVAAFLGLALVAVIIRINFFPSSPSGIDFKPLPENATSTESTTNSTSSMNENATNAGLEITDVKVGTGAEAVAGKEITVHYVGTLDDGTKFDSSRDRGTPFTFDLGVGQVIQGWDQGFAGMKVGGVRKLVIPAALAYGDRATGSIPAGSTLHFEVELLAVEDAQ